MDRTRDETVEGLNACRAVASLLNARVAEGIRDADADEITRFHSVRPPSIPMEDYLSRIYTYSQCPNACLVLALIYVDRLVAAPTDENTPPDPGSSPATRAAEAAALKLTILTVHRVTLAAVMLATKYLDDHQYYTNAFFSFPGGVPTAELNGLEREFLRRIRFSVHVSATTYSAVLVQLKTRGGANKCQRRPLQMLPHPIEVASADEAIATGGGLAAATPRHGAIVADAAMGAAVCGGGGGGCSRPTLLAVRGTVGGRRGGAPCGEGGSLRCGDVHDARTVEVRGEMIGEVRFVGDVHYGKGEWIGVATKDPVGKHDGTSKGVEYFACAPKHGLLLRLLDEVKVVVA